MKETILHVVESLAIGGAEILLTESLRDISDDYRHVVVYLRSNDTLLQDVKADKVYCLNYKGKRSFIRSILELKGIIVSEKVSLIHSHHYWPTIISRFAKPVTVPLIFSVHNILSKDAFELNKLSFYLEKLTYNEKQHAVFVSEAVKNDYQETIGIKGKSSIIHNFVSDKFDKAVYRRTQTNGAAIRVVAVGTLKKQKNYEYLLEVFKLLRGYNIFLDIYGDGPLLDNLVKEVNDLNLCNVMFKGAKRNIFEVLSNYDVFILTSKYEGLSLAVIEAMTVGLPCLLSDIASNVEAGGEAAVYVNLESPADCADKLIELLRNQDLLSELSSKSLKRAASFQKSKYLNDLEVMYQSYLRP